MRRALYALTVAALALTGCATDDDQDPTTSSSTASSPSTASPDEPAASSPAAPDTPSPAESPSPSDDVAAMDFASCDAQDYTVVHPVEWEVNDPGGIADACRVFHPAPVDLPDQPQDRDLHWAVSMGIDDVPFADVTAAEPAGEVLQERDTTIAGHDARVIEVRSEGDALVPDGEARYGYAVDLDGRTLLAHTYSVGETDYERDKQVLDRMMSELELTGTG